LEHSSIEGSLTGRQTFGRQTVWAKDHWATRRLGDRPLGDKVGPLGEISYWATVFNKAIMTEMKGVQVDH